jgi:hypothetical protein
MLDSGTTDHFIAVNASVKNIAPTSNQLNVTIPDGSIIKSTHECDIDWPELPKNACRGHIIPKLARQSLLLVVKLCNAGCTVVFHQNCCIILYDNKIIMYGTKFPKTGLWLVPLKQHKKLKNDNSQQPKITEEQQMNNIHQTSTQCELVTYLHQCLFSLTK